MDACFFANDLDLSGRLRVDDREQRYRVLVADLVGLRLDSRGEPDPAEFFAHVRSRGAYVHSAESVSALRELLDVSADDQPPGIHFYYAPHLNSAEEFVLVAGNSEFDAVVAAATALPPDALFPLGGVRIGAGTANMASQSFTSGAAPLMNTPSFNSRATAQSVFKAIFHFCPDLPLQELHQRVQARAFDTAAHLRNFPVAKLEGRRLAVLGFGNIGREVALLGRALCMNVVVFARPSMQRWIEAEGFEYADTVHGAAQDADVLSAHLGLGPVTDNGAFANAGIIDQAVLGGVAQGAVLINFDRAELVDVSALADALAAGRISNVAVDADVFLDRSAVPVRAVGPLADYVETLEPYTDRILLLPHVAADTDHPSRVAGARQAADQIIAAIRYGVLVNTVGEVPEGYHNLGNICLPGIGAIAPDVIDRLRRDDSAVAQLRSALATIDAWLSTLDQTAGEHTTSSAQEVHLHSAVETQRAIEAVNRFNADCQQLGLHGPGKAL